MAREPRPATALALLVLLTGGALLAQDAAIFDVVAMRDVKTRDLVTSARTAVFGGPGGVALLRSLRFKGTSHFPAEDGSMVSAAVEIRVMLPDHYLRIDTGSFGKRMSGFAGSTTLRLIEGPTGVPQLDPTDPRTALANDRAQLTRLMLGAAFYSSPAIPLALQTRDTPREMPGPSDPLGVDATGDNGFAARVVLDGKSRMPARVVYWGVDRSLLTMTLTERRSTGGMKAPFRIVTTAGDRVVDELAFDEVAVNPRMTKADFAR